MARDALTPIAAAGGYPAAGSEGKLVTFTAIVVANGFKYRSSGNDLVLVRNTDASAHTVTIASAVDRYNRQGDITEFSVAAGTIRAFGPFPVDGWAQSDGNINIDADDATIEVAVIQL